MNNSDFKKIKSVFLDLLSNSGRSKLFRIILTILSFILYSPTHFDAALPKDIRTDRISSFQKSAITCSLPACLQSLLALFSDLESRVNRQITEVKLQHWFQGKDIIIFCLHQPGLEKQPKWLRKKTEVRRKL